MTREDLFEAIGQVEEKCLAGSENRMSDAIFQLDDDGEEYRVGKRPVRRLLRNVLVAAVVVALLAASVVATPEVYQGITGNWLTQQLDYFTPTNAAGGSAHIFHERMEIEIQLNEDAPAELQTYYLPQMPEGYTLEFGMIYGGVEKIRRTRVECDWRGENSQNALRFIQVSRENWERGQEASVDMYGETSTVYQTELGGKEGLMIEVPEDDLYPKRHFYWTDGDSVCHLVFTWAVPMEDVEAIIESITVVEDLRHYMISCEDEDYLDYILSK